ncbi:hypothetical protein B0H67DRAFT_596742 [Lasiosphaeris hirsuta]|uniref:PH domain-containing protein n=1 Tax=Lasiosphaeris hirsuta TaxID=260670 RepID=A0AA40BAG0_9PEZI|nr:hypothetical protein B0H67DRAFT_596742 [Lasiosphaeris hirsuta]
MGRNRVLSFISQLSSRTPTPAPSPARDIPCNSRAKPDSTPSPPQLEDSRHSPPDTTTPTSPTSPASPTANGEHAVGPVSITTSTSSNPEGGSGRESRPSSMVQTFQPPLMDLNEETLPELQPIFTFLNSHSNKLYQEGYFLKLDDQDIKGRPNSDRTWTECFAQLVGTVLSLWDAAELDAAGEEGEVLPKFINLTDASIKMIESLPTRTNDEQPLQNILSISTAGRNRYLLHFNSHHSLIQWTSGIRLAMYEHSTLQEAYTGALIAGKGKTLNGINVIMERARVPVQEWVRVRFGAGVPWRRCWCVIEPPNEKEYQRSQKDLKKRSPYDRSHAPILKGEVRFYDSKKEADKKKKHSRPIASITDAYSAYAIYPQSKSLIDGSTLLKVEGNITIHSDPPSSTEGFVFIMPEVPPAVAGFEMLLRFLFPTWDTFGLYGRPGRLVASVLDSRSLMFAMPKHKRYGYLEILDVSQLILTDGNSAWSEREWRKKMKELTGQRMTAVEEGAKGQGRSASRSSKRLSFGPQNPPTARPRVGFADEAVSARSSRSMSLSQAGPRTDSAPPDPSRERAPSAMAVHSRHTRNSSDTQIGNIPPSLALEGPDMIPSIRTQDRAAAFAIDLASTPERVSSDDERQTKGPVENLREMQRMQTPEPVNAPPAFAHGAGSRPQQTPYHSPDLRRQTSRLSSTTLSQLVTASGLNLAAFSDEPAERKLAEAAVGSPPEQTDLRGPAVQTQTSASSVGINANFNGSREALTSPIYTNSSRPSPGLPPPDMGLAQKRSKSPLAGPNPSGGPPSFRPGHYMGGPPNDPRAFPPGQQRDPRPPRSPPINRKPLPQRTTSLQRPEGAGSPRPLPQPPNSGGIHTPQQDFSEESYAKSQSSEAPPPVPPHNPRRQNSDRSLASSHYDDASSTASPDYASTRRSTDTQESVDRPRAGVLKTTGNDSSPGFLPNSSEYGIPDINFGRTINYAASKAAPPAHPGVMPHQQHAFGPTPERASPIHFRQESDDTIRRTVAWQPGGAPGPLLAENVVSPEQFVQQRAAAAAATPVYSHQRNHSANTLTELRARTPTSPRKLPVSHSRHNSADLLHNGRPVSQGTVAALSNGEVSSYLSAREQEHVARVTGSPLVALSGNRGHPSQPGGLVGAIEIREREKSQMMQGIGGQAVAQAIDQRNREQNQQAHRAAQVAYSQQQAQLAAQQGYVGPQASMGVMGSGAPSVYSPSMGVMNTRNMSPGPGMMGGGTNPGRPGQGYQSPPTGHPQPQQRPQMMSPPPGSYSAAQNAQTFTPGGVWNKQSMSNMQARPLPQPPGPNIGAGMQRIPPQSPGFQTPPQGQYTPGGTQTGTRPGTPGRPPYQGPF